MSSAFIEDGYHQTAFIDGVFGQYESFWFEFRVATSLENARQDAFKKRKGGTPESEEELICSQLVGHIRKWSFTRNDGSLVEVTKENASRLHPFARLRMANVVEGFAPPDDPGDREPPEGYENVISKTAVEEVDDAQGN